MTTQEAQSAVLLAYTAGLGRDPSAAELDSAVQTIMADPTQESQVVTGIINSPEGLSHRAFLNALKDAVLGNARAQAALATLANAAP